jgi:cell fate regulator YaaT (PSP1 superfamily)
MSDETNTQAGGRKKPREGTRRRGGRGRTEPRLKLYNVVQVRFLPAFQRYEYDAHELMVRPGERVVVETARGPALGEVVDHVHRKSAPPDSLPRVLRVATQADIEQVERNALIEREAQLFALERIRARRLPLKLIRAQIMHDGSKIVFYFSADGRIDFRELVKDLAHKLRTRIEMHQIGVRDGAKMLGGIGPCGRELCCSTFLDNFAPVSIRMAKDQGLTLNPKKVSGMCGRLMCCLVYEQQIYKRMRKLLPRPGQQVDTPLGPGQVVSLDVINKLVHVRLEDMSQHTLPAAELALVGAQPYQVDEPDDADDTPLWDDVLTDEDELQPAARPAGRQEPQPAPQPREGRGDRRRDQPPEPQPTQAAAPASSSTVSPADEQAQRERSRNRRRGKGADERPAQPSAEPPADGAAAGSADETQRKRRRRRRRRSGGASGEGGGEEP